jgi:hypothetical protein
MAGIEPDVGANRRVGGRRPNTKDVPIEPHEVKVRESLRAVQMETVTTAKRILKGISSSHVPAVKS